MKTFVMNKIGLLVLMIVFSFEMNGQVSDSLTPKKTHIKTPFAFYVAPEYSYRFLSSKDANNDVEAYRDTLESAKLGYTAGIDALVYKKEKLGLWAGLSFADKGERAIGISSGNPISQDDLPISFSYNNHYYYLGVPVKARYEIFQKNGFVFFATAGLSANYLLSKKLTILLEYASKLPEKKTIAVSDGINKMNIAGSIGPGIQQKLDEKATFVVMPLFNYSFTSVVRNTPVKSHLYSVGLNIALQFAF